MNGAVFVEQPKAVKYINDADSSIFTVGHNRAATAGIVSQENAHPFTHTNEHRTVTGVHNGTLNEWSKVKDSKDFKVDSDWAMFKLAKEGPVDAFEYFRGAFCFVWYDDDDELVLNIARNKERPMFFAFVKDKEQMLFASEPGMLGWLAIRNNLNIESTVYELTSGFHYKFDLNNPRLFTKKELVKDNYEHFYTPAPARQGKRGSRRNPYANASDETQFDSDWGDLEGVGMGWMGGGSTSDGQQRFLNKMEKFLSAEEVKETTVLTREQLRLSVLEDDDELAVQGTYERLDEKVDGVYNVEAEEAESLQLKDMEVTCEFFFHDEDNSVAYFEFLFVTDEKNSCDFFKGVQIVEVREVTAATAKSLKQGGTHRLNIKGVYYGRSPPFDPCLVGDNATIKQCRKAISAAAAAK